MKVKPASLTKKQLLNASQRKYLTERIESHHRKLHYEQEEDGSEPPEIVAARKLIDDWETKVEVEQKAREAAVRKALKARVNRLHEALLFESTEDAIRKVSEFEETTREEYLSPEPEPEPTGRRRTGSPSWDDE